MFIVIIVYFRVYQRHEENVTVLIHLHAPLLVTPPPYYDVAEIAANIRWQANRLYAILILSAEVV